MTLFDSPDQRPREHRSLPLDSIQTDSFTQARVALDPAVVEQYADAMSGGDKFPDILIYHDGERYWLADGRHRMEAARAISRSTIGAEIAYGTRRDAVLYAVGANATHGLPRSNADKRRAVEILLMDDEWSKWSDHEIARRARVSQPFVRGVRKELSDNGYQIANEARTVTRGGTTYEQRVSSEVRREARRQDADGAAVNGLADSILVLLAKGPLSHDEILQSTDLAGTSNIVNAQKLDDVLNALVNERLISHAAGWYALAVQPTNAADDRPLPELQPPPGDAAVPDSDAPASAPAETPVSLPDDEQTQAASDGERILSAFPQSPSVGLTPRFLREVTGLQPERFWKAVNLLEADGQVARDPGGNLSRATPDQYLSAKDERTAITKAILDVFAKPCAPLTYQGVWRAVDETLGRKVNAGIFSGVMHGLVSERRIKASAGGRYKLPETAEQAEIPAPETPTSDAPPDPALSPAATVQRDRAQAAEAEAQNAAAWQTAQTRARLEKAMCDLRDALTAASEVRGIRSFAEIFSAEDMADTRRLILDALAYHDQVRPHLETLASKLDEMIETGKPYAEKPTQ